MKWVLQLAMLLVQVGKLIDYGSRSWSLTTGSRSRTGRDAAILGNGFTVRDAERGGRNGGG